MTKLTIWFWQRMVTPHMAYLAEALARRGHDVTYVAEEELSSDRMALGWHLPELRGVTLHFMANAKEATLLAERSPAQTIHLTQGLRSNGSVRSAQIAVKARGQRHFVIMETVDQRGIAALLKPALYSWHLHRWRRGLHGILGIGADTPNWLRQLAPKGLHIFPFAYFLPRAFPTPLISGSHFRFLFVGSLIPRKRVDLLLKTLARISEHEFEVEVVGDGALRAELEILAKEVLPGRVAFRGVVPISRVPAHIAASDCLVLPSAHDGWGAVVSEALMMGTPVICSAACGARRVVEASGAGGVFATHQPDTFRDLLATALVKSKSDEFNRDALKTWARCLTTEAGAAYLENIILAELAGASRFPTPPWEPNK